MKTIKLVLPIMLLIVFAGFQYGGPVGDAPFHDSWQTYSIGIILAITTFFSIGDLLSYIKSKNWA